jgi:hypothetical protein
MRTGSLPLPQTEQIWNTPKGRMAIAFAVPLGQMYVRDHFGLWLAKNAHIDIVTMDSEKIQNAVVLALTIGAGVWGWINKRVPTWAALIALLGASIFLWIRAGNAAWRTQHFTEMAVAVAFGFVGLALVLWRVWCGLSPKAPNTPPVSGTESLGPLVSRLTA